MWSSAGTMMFLLVGFLGFVGTTAVQLSSTDGGLVPSGTEGAGTQAVAAGRATPPTPPTTLSSLLSVSRTEGKPETPETPVSRTEGKETEADGVPHAFFPKVIFVPSPPFPRIFPCNPPAHL